jgi:hypothetical protein
MPEKMRAILGKRYQSHNKKRVQFLRSFSKQDTLRTSISVQLFTTTKKTEWYKELFNIINNEVSEELKTSWSRMYFPLTMLIFTK